MSFRRVVRVGLMVGLCAGAPWPFGCGDDDGSGANASDGGGSGGAANGDADGGKVPASSAAKVGDKASADISAADGGELTLDGITASIPAGALADDTTLTVEVLDASKQPGADDIVADVYDFGPDGTEFLKPVTLELAVGSLKVPTGKDAVLAYLDGDAWVPLSDSKLKSGKVSATTMHFTPFTVVLIAHADGTIEQTGGACATDAFDACGGDLVGTWVYDAACVTLPPDALSSGGTNPFEACAEQPQLSVTVDLTGSTTFDQDGTFTLDQTVTSSNELRIPASCVADLSMGGDPAMACTDILQGTLDANGDCVSGSDMPDMSTSMETGTWSADSSTGTLTVDTTKGADAGTPDGGTDTKNEEVHYCVMGDSVTVVVTNLDDMTTIRYTATRQ